MENAPASRPARPEMRTARESEAAAPLDAPATPRIRLAFETRPSFAPNTMARRFEPAALRWRLPISDSGRLSGCPSGLAA